MSETLKMIMKYWSAPFPPEESPINLPFDIQAFCAENDQKIKTCLAPRSVDFGNQVGGECGCLIKGPH